MNERKARFAKQEGNAVFQKKDLQTKKANLEL